LEVGRGWLSRGLLRLSAYTGAGTRDSRPAVHTLSPLQAMLWDALSSAFSTVPQARHARGLLLQGADGVAPCVLGGSRSRPEWR
jgi:hypothetical protein